MDDGPSPSPAPHDSVGDRSVASVIARHDWSASPLGPMEGWPGELRSLLRVLLTSRFSMWLGWGPDLAFFYNDAYRRDTLGMKHPWALGRPAREVWAEAWTDLAPRIDQVMSGGRATWDEALELHLQRGGYPEETFHTFSYSPIPAEDGSVRGLLCVVTEETHRVVVGRRMATLRQLASDLSAQLSEDEMLAALGRGLETNPRDLPFALVYLEDEPGVARLACTSGIEPGTAGAPGLLTGTAGPWPLPADGGALVVDDLERRFGPLPGGAWDRPPSHAVVLPLTGRTGEGPIGWFVAALNPLRPVDQESLGWVELLAGQIAASLATARAYEDERRRAEALAELDRAKTTFFSDISHELRTPLTLMSGPLQEAVDRPDLPADLRERLGFAHRGSGRLLKLVNTLLEFARIEAGRVQARFEPLDLAAFTEDIASAFRSGAEAMGLRMTVECAPLPEPVFVDPEMWEKVVSNLLSNALKFTHDGEVGLHLATEDGHAVLRVRDTGIGIGPDDLPQLFQRFHRVRGAAGRTHEGSGIGLALVSELAQLHGGDASVISQPGVGSEFTVRVPTGRAHVPDDHLADGPGRHDGATTRLFVQEVMSWTGQVEDSPEPPVRADPLATATGRILLADDNADMRAYLSRLLGGRYRVDAVADGKAALAAVRDDPPDLVVSDVMMPRVDGLELVRRLRADPATARVPVMLLSARAGEEASAEGLAAGADDYLLKPFTARELLARVGAHIALGRARREAEEQERAARERIEALQARTARDEQRLRLLATASTTCLWGTDAAGVVREPSPTWEEFTGQAPGAYVGSVRGWLEAFDPADREIPLSWFTADAEPVEAVARLRRADGETRRVRLHAVPVLMDDGSVAEWVASATDVEDELRLRGENERQHRDLRVAQTQIAQATAAGRVGVWSLEVAEGAITVDAVLSEMFGVGDAGDAAATVPLGRVMDAIEPDDRDRVAAAVDAAVRGDGDYEAEFRVRGRDGRMRWVNGRGVCELAVDGRPQRLSGVGIDITEERRAVERLEFLARAGKLLAGSRDLQQTLIMVADLASPLLADFAVFDLIEDGSVVKVAGRHASPGRRDFAVQAGGFTPPLDHPHHPAAVAMRTGEVVIVDAVTDAWIASIALNDAHAAFMRSLEISSFLCVPLLAGDVVIGALSLVFSESGRRHGPAEVRLAEELAARSAIAIENAHLFSRVEEARRRAEAQTREQARLLASEREALSRARLLERNAAHLAAALTVEDVCRSTADDLEAFGLDVVVVQVLQDAGTLEAVAIAGVATGDMDEQMRLFPLSRDDMVPAAIRGGTPVEFQRGGDRDTRFPASSEARRLHAIETSIAIPLADSAGHVVGALYAGSREEDWLTDARRAVLHGTAQQCGLALERARLHQVERRSRMRSELIAAVLGEMEGRIGLAARAEAMLDALVPRVADAGAVTASGPDRSVVAVTRLEAGELEAVDDPRAHGWVTVPLADAGLELLLGMRDGRNDEVLHDPHLMGDLAQRAALALQTARLHDEEHQIAVELQRSLLPSQLNVVDGVGVEARYQTAERRLEVGGDWYDTIPLPDGRIALCVGDVVGHGLGAGIVMGQLRNALLTQAPAGEGPADLVDRLERVAARIDGAELTTVCYAELDPRDGELVYACAGHPPPLLVHASGEAEFLWGGRSAPLCSPAVRTRHEGRARLGPGARLLMYSDGLVERRLQDIDERFAQLAAAAARASGAPLGAFCDTTISLMTAGELRDDDLALLCTEYRPQVGERLRARFPAEAGALSDMRRAVDAWAARLGIADRGDLVLACGEACSNAVEHAYRDGSAGEVLLDAGFDGRAVELRIRDHGAWRAPTDRPERGRGLDILRAVADEVVLTPGDTGSSVTFRIPVSAAEGAVTEPA